MKILHVNHLACFKGGVEQILFDTITGLNKRGWQNALLCQDAEVDDKFKAVCTGLFHDDKQIDDFNPDVILVHKFNHMSKISQWQQRYPVYMMVHDHDLVCLRKHKYFPLSQQICERAAGLGCLTSLCNIQKSSESLLPVKVVSLREHVKNLALGRDLQGYIVGSDWMKNSLANNGISADKISVIAPIPASITQVNPSPLPENSNILYVGQLVRGKGVDLLLHALAQLEGQWQADIVGEGNAKDALIAQATSLGISDRVNFRGWVNHSEIDELYRSALFSVVPSRWPEPFGMVGVEAMSRGRPVIAFAVGGIPDWLTHMYSGLLVPAQDIIGLSKAMQLLLNDRSLAGHLAKGAKDTVDTHFQHEQYITQMETLLEMAG